MSGLPIYSATTNPALGGTSANVTTAPTAVPGNSLLLNWVKNDATGATAAASAASAWMLDPPVTCGPSIPPLN